MSTPESVNEAPAIRSRRITFRRQRAQVFALLALVLAAAAMSSCTTDRTRRAYLRANAAHFTAPENPVIVIPGFGVTRLLDPETDRYVWGTPRATVRTAWPDDLDLPVDHGTRTIGRDRLVPRGYVGSRGPINTGWQLTIALQKFGGSQEGRSVYPFYYDWRLGALDNAARLDAFAREIRQSHGGAKVDVITHSAGGMVALAWVKLAGGGESVRNLVLVAPPLRGVVDAFRVMVRPEKFIRRTFTADVVATWPFVPELLPEDGKIFVDESGNELELDLWSPASWERLRHYDAKHHDVFIASLERARTFRKRLAEAELPAGVSLHILPNSRLSAAGGRLRADCPQGRRPPGRVLRLLPGRTVGTRAAAPVTAFRAGRRHRSGVEHALDRAA